MKPTNEDLKNVRDILVYQNRGTILAARPESVRLLDGSVTDLVSAYYNLSAHDNFVYQIHKLGEILKEEFLEIFRQRNTDPIVVPSALLIRELALFVVKNAERLPR